MEIVPGIVNAQLKIYVVAFKLHIYISVQYAAKYQ